MRLLTITILAILIIASSLYAQAPDTMWTKTYSAIGDALALSVVPASDGGYFVGGTIYHDSVRDTSGWRDSDFWVLRLDEQGDTLWTRSYGDSLWSEWTTQLTATADGGFAIAGDRQRLQADDLMYVVKADSEGELQWEATYSTDHSSYNTVVGISHMMTNNLTLANNTLGNGKDFAVMNIYGGWHYDLEGAGDEVYRVRHSWARDDWVGAVTATSDNGFVVCGWTTSTSSVIHEELFLMKSGEFGMVEWSRIYDSPGATDPMGVRQTRDGGYIVVGKASEPYDGGDPGLYLLKTDAEGDKIWSRSYGGSGGRDVIELPDGGFLAISMGGSATRVSSSGEQVWSGSYAFGQAATLAAAPSPDGGYILAGWTFTPGNEPWIPGVYEARIVKLAPDGEPTDVDDDQMDIIPTSVTMDQNYPNPFNPNTTIEFELPHRSQVKIEVFNLLGQKICSLLDEPKSAGTHQIQWTGTDDTGQPAATGIYFYRLHTDDTVETRKMLLLK